MNAKSLIRIFKTSPREANILTAISTALLLVKICYLNKITEIVPGFYAMGVIVETILESILASWVFFLFVVHFKNFSDKNRLNSFFSRYAESIVGDCIIIIRDFGKASSTGITLQDLDNDTLMKAMKLIDPHSVSPMRSGYPPKNVDWFSYLALKKIRTQTSINKIMSQLIYVDIELVQLLTDINECTYFMTIECLPFLPIPSTDLTPWAEPLYEYSQIISRLDKYIKKNLS